MAEPSLSPPRLAGSDTVEYQPLSLLAVFSVVCSGIYAGWLLLSTVVGLYKGDPVFISGWWVLFAVAGVMLALAARWQIERAEGTLAGLPLTRWGLWLSLLAVLGYYAYVGATGLALTQQAYRFAMEMDEQGESGVYPRLLQGDAVGAFLLLHTPKRRSGIRPGDPNSLEALYRQFDTPNALTFKGELTTFLESDLVYICGKAGEEKRSVEEQGVKDWFYEKGGYLVARNFKVSCSEAELTMTLFTRSMNTPEGRKWFVDNELTKAFTQTSLTPLGQGLNQLRQRARTELYTQLANLKTDSRLKPVLPEEAQFARMRVPDESLRIRAREEIVQLFSGDTANVNRLLTNPKLGPWSKDGQGRVTLALPLIATVLQKFATPKVEYALAATVHMRSKTAVDPQRFASSVAIDEWPQWEIERIELTALLAATKKQG